MKYLYHEEQIDERKPACYILVYRGIKYYSCYGITLEEWLDMLYLNPPPDISKGRED